MRAISKERSGRCKNPSISVCNLTYCSPTSSFLPHSRAAFDRLGPQGAVRPAAKKANWSPRRRHACPRQQQSASTSFSNQFELSMICCGSLHGCDHDHRTARRRHTTDRHAHTDSPDWGTQNISRRPARGRYSGCGLERSSLPHRFARQKNQAPGPATVRREADHAQHPSRGRGISVFMPPSAAHLEHAAIGFSIPPQQQWDQAELVAKLLPFARSRR